MKKSDLPFELVDRYDGIHSRPIISWTNAHSMDWDEARIILTELGFCTDWVQSKALFELAQSGEGEGRIVELGSWAFYGAIALALGSKSVDREKVITIDNNHGGRGQHTLYNGPYFWNNDLGIKFQAYMNMIMSGTQDYIHPIGMSSQEASEALSIDIRLLHVDACHKKPHPAADILMWEDMIVPGGWVVCHDYKHDVDDVEECINEFVVPNPKFGDVIELSLSTCKFQRL